MMTPDPLTVSAIQAAVDTLNRDFEHLAASVAQLLNSADYPRSADIVLEKILELGEGSLSINLGPADHAGPVYHIAPLVSADDPEYAAALARAVVNVMFIRGHHGVGVYVVNATGDARIFQVVDDEGTVRVLSGNVMRLEES